MKCITLLQWHYSRGDDNRSLPVICAFTLLDYILIAPLIKVFSINIAISLNVSWNKNLHDDPLFLSNFWLIYVHIFHFGKYQKLFNSRSKIAHLPLSKCLMVGGMQSI